ncbi:unnamed protein product [Phyllotreta striolata]|uniref:Ku domain-containing protein n=1 Tax=Phyllotreta striolata TaxID=444603 RepID=A0A9N9TL90_PHYSR|nr:unnamed protein product [Phyllotreta striolata]
MSKIDEVWILFDVASTIKRQLLTGLLQFTTYQWLKNPMKYNYKLLLINTESTKNINNIPNICLIETSKRYDPKFIETSIEESQPTDSPTANFEALNIAIDYLKRCQDNKSILTRQIIYFTSLEHRNSNTNDLLIDKIIKRINKYQIYLYFIGPEVDLPYPITHPEMIYECMADLMIDESKENLMIASKIVKGTNYSVMCRVEIGTPHLLLSFKLSQGTKPWNEPLSFGENFQVPVKSFKIIRKDLNIKIVREKTTKKIRVLADNLDEIVAEEDLVKGRVLAGRFLQIDPAQFRPDTKKCLDVLGFVKKESIPPTLLAGEDVYRVLPYDDKEEWFQFFTYLIKELDKSEKYGIVKRVYAATNKPRYYALIPDIYNTPKCFIMIALPYRHEYVPFKCKIPEVPVKEAPENQKDEISDYLNSLTVDNENSNCKFTTLAPVMKLAEDQRRIVDEILKNCIGEEFFKFENFDLNFSEKNEFIENLNLMWDTN